MGFLDVSVTILKEPCLANHNSRLSVSNPRLPETSKSDPVPQPRCRAPPSGVFLMGRVTVSGCRGPGDFCRSFTSRIILFHGDQSRWRQCCNEATGKGCRTNRQSPEPFCLHASMRPLADCCKTLHRQTSFPHLAGSLASMLQDCQRAATARYRRQSHRASVQNP